jgi:hypothetical protein
MSATNPLRAEIDEILRRNPRTRYAKVLLGMERGLTDAQIAQDAVRAGESVDTKRIAWVRETVRMTLDGEVAVGAARAKNQAGLYRELLNYSMSPDLSQHIKTRLAQLQGIDPTITNEPLGDVHLGRNDKSSAREPEKPCDKCFTVHKGECL